MRVVRTAKDFRPKNNEPLNLFQYCVKKAMEIGEIDNPYTHLQWASKLFPYEKDVTNRRELMSIVKREFGIYFTSDLKYNFLTEKIQEHYPQWFGITSNENMPEDPIERLFYSIQKALNKEIKEQNNPRNRESFKVVELDTLLQQGGKYVCRAVLKADDGSDPHFGEGIAFTLRQNGVGYTCEAIEYDVVNGVLLFTANRRMTWSSSCTIFADNTFILEGLINRLKSIASGKVEDTIPIIKFFNKSTKDIRKVEHTWVSPELSQRLDESQRKAYNAALEYDLTFIWGPPGTGKSFTLAAIIDALYEMKNERTAVCCVSNVAVDQLVNKVIDIFDEQGKHVAPGNIYRAGRSIDERILATNYLFPTDTETQRLRTKIRKNKEKLDELKRRKQDYTETSIALKAENKDLREKLKNHTDYLVSNSKVVFSTISNFVLSSSINGSHFDNLIVDEASMLALPSLIALASRITKRIILVGDFQQLPPIAMVPDPLLLDNVFKFSGIDIDKIFHPALHLLLNQRRSNKKIVDLFNVVFYANKLQAKNVDKHEIAMLPPFAGNIVGMKDVKNGSVRFTKGGTRQNKVFAEAVVSLLDKYAARQTDTFSIGIVTPYKGQVSLLRALIGERKYSETFMKRLKIGTVHTFQGSESDVIIYDMVDCKTLESGQKANIGKIYAGSEGEQLLNVAISRARHKLIVIADASYLVSIPGNKISKRTQEIFTLINKYRFTKE